VRWFTTFGVHPYNAASEGAVPSLDALRAMLPPTVSAVGECGLDASPGFPPLEAQLPWFEAQLDLAWAVGVPLYLHERGAHGEFVERIEARVRRASPRAPKLLVHCFTGDAAELRKYLDMGCYVSVSGVVLKPGEVGDRVRAALAAHPPAPDRLMVETDAPYKGFPGCRRRAPKPDEREFPNVPAALPAVVRGLAHVLGRDPAQLAADSFACAEEFFGASAAGST